MDEQRNNITLLEAVERYITGNMNPDERLHFENLRKADSDVDQMVAEHTLFLQKMNRFNQWNKFQTTLNEVHNNLSAQGKINAATPKGGKILYMINRFKKTAAIAASIAGITALIVSGIVGSVTPKAPVSQLEILKRDINNLAQKSRKQDMEIHNLKQGSAPVNPEIPYTNSGTGFIIDGKGYLVTNFHVVEKAQNIAVQNTAGKEFFAQLVYTDAATDIAILKINDPGFKVLPGTPYSFTKKPTDLAEPIFTLGYPKNDEIVYGQGYLSAKTGYNGDTLSCQIDINAERGNSGSPVLNNNGEVIGILNAKQKDANGVAFAIQSRNIFNALSELKKKPDTDSTLKTVKLNTKSSLSGLKGPQQVKKIEDYIYMVKVN